MAMTGPRRTDEELLEHVREWPPTSSIRLRGASTANGSATSSPTAPLAYSLPNESHVR